MDLQALLTPLASTHGRCGEDMTFSLEFNSIQEARRFDDPSLSQGEWITDLKESDWPAVIRLCEDILCHKSKDLRIAAWLAEAYCKRHGLNGLAEGYQLLDKLANEYWEDIHPLPEDNDQEERAGLFDWLNQQTHRLIREAPITHSNKGRFSLTDREAARLAAHMVEKNLESGDAAATPTVSIEMFEAATRDTPRSFFAEELQAAQRLREAMESLQLLLDSQMGGLSPTFSASFESLDELRRFCTIHAGAADTSDAAGHKAKAVTPALKETATNERMEPVITTLPDHSDSVSAPIRSREQAIRQLNEIAHFFQRTEPHSPVAYLANKAAKWGAMPLHVWLRSVIKDDTALSHMEELLGVESIGGEDTPG